MQRQAVVVDGGKHLLHAVDGQTAHIEQRGDETQPSEVLLGVIGLVDRRSATRGQQTLAQVVLDRRDRSAAATAQLGDLQLATCLLTARMESSTIYCMTPASRRLAGTLLVLLPTVVLGGVSLLGLINNPAYRDNELRQDLWRAGHAHAGVLLVLALVALRYVDETHLSPRARWFARHSIPTSAVLLPVAFFLSVTDARATEPNVLINLAYAGAFLLTGGLLTLGIGLLRHPPSAS